MNWCLREIKWLVFFISGQCQRSGYCCESIQIRYDYQPVRSVTQFKSIVANDSVMSRFKPVVSGDTIHHFDCSCLMSDRRCSHYHSRPSFCVQYPDSVFLSDAILHYHCGYRIQERFLLPFFSSRFVRDHIALFKVNNRVIS